MEISWGRDECDERREVVERRRLREIKEKVLEERRRKLEIEEFERKREQEELERQKQNFEANKREVKQQETESEVKDSKIDFNKLSETFRGKEISLKDLDQIQELTKETILKNLETEKSYLKRIKEECEKILKDKELQLSLLERDKEALRGIKDSRMEVAREKEEQVDLLKKDKHIIEKLEEKREKLAWEWGEQIHFLDKERDTVDKLIQERKEVLKEKERHLELLDTEKTEIEQLKQEREALSGEKEALLALLEKEKDEINVIQQEFETITREKKVEKSMIEVITQTNEAFKQIKEDEIQWENEARDTLDNLLKEQIENQINLQFRKLMKEYTGETNKKANHGLKLTKKFKKWLEAHPSLETTEKQKLLEYSKNKENEKRILNDLMIEELQEIASQRGGKCLSSKYINARTKLEWECKEGHEWEATYHNIKKGHWCPKCAKEVGLKRRLTIEEMQEVAKQRGGKCLSTEYKDIHTKLKWECKEGHVWEATPANIRKDQWCPKCGAKERGEKRKLTIEEMQDIARQRDGKCLSAEYINSDTKLEWQCKEGHEWEATPSSIKSGRWCSKCANKETGLKRRLTIEEMQDIARQRSGKCLSTEYHNAKTKLRWECKEGHLWEATAAHIKNGTWCPDCGAKEAGLKLRLTIEEMQDIARQRGGKCLSAEYINSDTKLEWQCKEGHEWEATPSSIKRGTWCPECNVRVSEIICRGIFETIFKKEFPKARPAWLINDQGNRMELDGFSEELALAFEYQGIQHYEYTPPFHELVEDFERRKNYDQLKRELCKKNGIVLIEIPFTIGYKQMGDFIINKCKENKINVPKDSEEINYEELINKSYAEVRRREKSLEEY